MSKDRDEERLLALWKLARESREQKGMGNRKGYPAEKDYAKATTVNEAWLTATFGTFSREDFLDILFHYHCHQEIENPTTAAEENAKAINDRRKKRVSRYMLKAVEKGDATFFEDLAKFMRWMKVQENYLGIDPDTAAVLELIQLIRQEKQDPTWV